MNKRCFLTGAFTYTKSDLYFFFRRVNLNKRLIVGCGILLSLMACESRSDVRILDVEKPVSVIEPIEEIEEPASVIEPIEEVEKPASVIEPVEEVEEPDQNQQVSEASLMNQALIELNLTLGEEHMGAVIHNPLENQLNAVQVINYTAEPVEEGFLFIPKVIGTQIQIYEVSWENDELVSGDLLFEQKDLQDREALYLQCPVPEGIPRLKVVIEDDEQRVDYVITYDGIGMQDQIELLTGEID